MGPEETTKGYRTGHPQKIERKHEETQAKYNSFPEIALCRRWNTCIDCLEKIIIFSKLNENVSFSFII
jgi:hypothetical protein